MTWRAAKYFLGFVRKYAAQETLLLVLVAVSSAGVLVSPYVLKILIDDVFPSADFRLLAEVLAVYALICTVRIGVQYTSSVLFEKVGNSIVRDMRLDLFEHVMRMPLSYFAENKSGDIIHRISNEADSIQSVLTGSAIRLVSNVCLITGLVVMLCILDVKLFLVTAAVFPLMLLATYYFQPRLYAVARKARQKDSFVLSYLLERIRNVRLIKNYVTYSYEKNGVRRHLDEQVDINMKRVRLGTVSRTVTLGLTVAAPVAILAVGGRDVMYGIMTVGTLVAFIQYTNRMFDPFRDMVGLYFDFVRASVSMERIYELMQSPEEADMPGSEAVDIAGREIRFEDVVFGYGGVKVLKGFSFTFMPGRCYAIVGESGAGKSTVLDLLCGFVRPDGGRIYAGDTDIRRIEMRSYRRQLNVITQNNHIFNDTLLNNILYGNTKAGQDRVEEAVRRCGLYATVCSNGRGYGTFVGDSGATLSGGELQRVALARGMLRKACVTIMDEATSAVDSENEKRIIENLLEENKNGIVIIVSHRLSAVRKADCIVCLHDGAVAEQGTHDELVSKGGFYRKLFEEQLDSE